MPGPSSQRHVEVLGLELSPLTPERAPSFNLGRDAVTGVVDHQVDPDSDAADKGLSPATWSCASTTAPCDAAGRCQTGVPKRTKAGRNSVLLLVTHAGRHRLRRDRLGKA